MLTPEEKIEKAEALLALILVDARSVPEGKTDESDLINWIVDKVDNYFKTTRGV